MLSQQIVVALRRKYEAEIDCARTNVQVYLNHPAGVAEHPDMVSTIDTQIERIASAEDKLKALDRYLK